MNSEPPHLPSFQLMRHSDQFLQWCYFHRSKQPSHLWVARKSIHSDFAQMIWMHLVNGQVLTGLHLMCLWSNFNERFVSLGGRYCLPKCLSAKYTIFHANLNNSARVCAPLMVACSCTLEPSRINDEEWTPCMLRFVCFRWDGLKTWAELLRPCLNAIHKMKPSGLWSYAP